MPMNCEVKIPVQVSSPSLETPLNVKVADEPVTCPFTLLFWNVKGDPIGGLGRVQLCGGVVAAGGSAQPVAPPLPPAMKLINNEGNAGAVGKSIKSTGVKTVLTGSAALFKL